MNIIVTPRLLLRPFEAADLPEVERLFADEQVMRFIGPPRTREQSAAKLEAMISNFVRHGFGMFAVFDRREKVFVGRCGLQPLSGTDLIELGYTFFPSAWGKGYATEASKAVTLRAFSEWGLEEIVAITVPEHTASIHVMEKLGMHYERSEVFYDRICVLYSLSKKKLIQPSMRPFAGPRRSPHQSRRDLYVK